MQQLIKDIMGKGQKTDRLQALAEELAKDLKTPEDLSALSAEILNSRHKCNTAIRHVAMGWSPEQISHESIYRFIYHCTTERLPAFAGSRSVQVIKILQCDLIYL